MRWSVSVGAWTRWDTLLAAAAAVAAAAAAFSEPLGIGWLKTAGVIVAAVFAVALLVVKVGKARVEAGRERAEADRRLRVPVAPISEIDLHLIGVDRAAQTVLAGGERPTYLPRTQDGVLRAGIVEALGGRGRWLIVAVGPSKVGKSRMLFEAVTAADQAAAAGQERVRVVAPVDGAALLALLVPGQEPRLGRGPVVLWLDDVEPFLNQGVTWQALQQWHAGGRGGARVVVGTYGGKGSDRIAGTTAAGLATTAAEVMQHALEVPVAATTATEEAGLPDPGAAGPGGSGVDPEDRAVIRRFGLAAFLVAGPALARKLSTGRHTAGADPCPQGVAVVAGVVDWARCGRTDPIEDAVLRQLWPGYLPAGAAATDAGFTTGLAWAVLPVAGHIALIHQTGSYTAYDFVVRLRRQDPASPPPPAAVWEAAISTATPTQAAAVATAAYFAGWLDTAAAALDQARNAGTPDVAARAGVNLGVVLTELGRSEEALLVYGRVVADYGGDPAPTLREQVAAALYNHGYRLGVLGRGEEALAVYGRVVADYGGDPAPALRERVAAALHNQGYQLGELGRGEEALAVYGRVVADYGGDPAPALREQVAETLVNQGNRLGVLGRGEEALAVYGRVVADYGGDPAPALREHVAKALVNQGNQLGELGRGEEALAVYGRVVADYGGDPAPAPALREHVAKALYNQGNQLGELGRGEEALAVYGRVVAEYAGDPAPALREQVAAALYNQGNRLNVLGRGEEALAVYRRVVADYAGDPAPALRERVAAALYGQGYQLGVLGRGEEALAVYRRVVAEYAGDPAPALRERVAAALYGQGNRLNVLGRGEEALAVYRRVVADYAVDPAPALQEAVRRARDKLTESDRDE